jgi:small GTP-binding protein
MSQTNRGERLQIAIMGARNAGKSSLINALLGQNAALISPVPGTTTDPVAKAMELHPLGPVTLIDSAGIDEDESPLGQARAQRSLSEIPRSDLLIVLLDAARLHESLPMVDLIRARALAHAIPCVFALNKCDLCCDEGRAAEEALRIHIDGIEGGAGDPAGAQPRGGSGGGEASPRTILFAGLLPVVRISAQTRAGLSELRNALITLLGAERERPSLVAGLLPAGGLALLVLPIDSAAPKGRLILPQVQTMRAILDHGASFIGTQTRTLQQCLGALDRKPDIVITDSQDFAQVAAILPPDQALTSFSILFARAKGDIDELIRGAAALDALKDGDRILIAEACSHHAQEDDIGTVKIPRMLREKCGVALNIEKCSGRDFPENLTGYRVIIHCGSCMLTERETRARMALAADAGVAITNYGITIAWYSGILERATAAIK